MSNIAATRAPMPNVMKGRAPSVDEIKYPVWNQDGVMEMHTRQNINDLVRFNGYFDRDPAEIARALPAHLVAAGVHEAPAADPGAPPVVNPRLTALRNEITALGGEYLPQWGIKSLESALASLKISLAKVQHFPVHDPAPAGAGVAVKPTFMQEDPDAA